VTLSSSLSAAVEECACGSYSLYARHWLSRPVWYCACFSRQTPLGTTINSLGRDKISTADCNVDCLLSGVAASSIGRCGGGLLYSAAFHRGICRTVWWRNSWALAMGRCCARFRWYPSRFATRRGSLCLGSTTPNLVGSSLCVGDDPDPHQMSQRTPRRACS